MIGRRIVLAGGGALLAAGAASAQARRILVGYFGMASRIDDGNVEGLRTGLAEAADRGGQPAELVVLQADLDPARGAAMLKDAAERGTGVLVTAGPASTRLAHKLTTLPIVAIGLTSLDRDLFESISRPGGRVTGFATFGEDLADKRISLLLEMVPRLRFVGVIHNRVDPNFEQWGRQTVDAARRAGLQAVQLGLAAGGADEVKDVLRQGVALDAQALLVIRDFVTVSAQEAILREAAARGLAVMAEIETFPQSGALASFGADLPDLFRRAAVLVHKIGSGASPADIPIEAPTKFRFVLNLKTARTLKLDIPPATLARADEVIE